MVLLALPPADHLLIDTDRGQFVPCRRRRMMANVRAECLLKIPAEPSPELVPGAAAQTRMISVAKIRLDRRKSTRLFKGIICDDISEFESHMPSQAVWSPSGRIQDSRGRLRSSLRPRSRRGLHVSALRLSVRSVRIHEHANCCRLGHELVQQLQSLRP